MPVTEAKVAWFDPVSAKSLVPVYTGPPPGRGRGGRGASGVFGGSGGLGRGVIAPGAATPEMPNKQ